MKTIVKLSLSIAAMLIVSCGSGDTGEGYSGDTTGVNNSARAEDSVVSGVADGRMDGDSAARAATPADNTSSGDTSGNPITR